MYNNGKQILFGFYNGKFISKGYFGNNLIFNGDLITITINPTPNDAKVTFSDYGIGIISNDGKSLTVKKGTVINYTVSKEGYRIIEDSIELQSNTTLNVELLLYSVLNVKDYNYSVNTIDNLINVTLTEYIGTDTNVVVPQIEMR